MEFPFYGEEEDKTLPKWLPKPMLRTFAVTNEDLPANPL